LNASLEGRIDISLTLSKGVVCGVSIRSSRPRLAQKLMAGCTPEVAAERAALIFSLCGKAQRVAAEAACEAAQNVLPDAKTDKVREQRVLIELAQEHAWQLLLNWPEKTGRLADMTSLLALRQSVTDPLRFGETLDRLLHDVFLGDAPAAWLLQDLPAFDLWRRQGATLPAQLFGTWAESDERGISQTMLLPPLQHLNVTQCAVLARHALADDEFCAHPVWAGAPAETGALARMQDHPLLAAWLARRGRGVGARLLARLLELAELPQRLSVGDCTVVKAYPLGDNTGMAAIETSRGLLIHAVRLSGNMVTDYRIVAPTEWNFHPAGPLAQALVNLETGDDVVARAQEICQSLDPCVAFGVELSHA
jgi:GNAT superfamily N-acetyltransferase